MKKSLIVPALSVVLCGLGKGTCSAQPAPSALGATCAAAYTPAKGSAARQQIADAMRGSLRKTTGISAIFVFDWLRANGNWAYAEANPESADGQSHYEPVFALLRRSNGVWRVAWQGYADDQTSSQSSVRLLKRNYPSAPRNIFPR